MWQAIRQHPWAAVLAVLAHVALIAILVVSFTWPEAKAPGTPAKAPPEAVSVTAVDERQVERELEKIKAAERRRQEAARKAREARQREEKRLAELRRKRQLEEKKRKEAERKRKAKEAAERKRRAEAERKRRLEEQKRREAERKRREEEKRLAERKRQEEEKARQAEIARQEAELQRQIEARRQAAARRAARQKAVDEWSTKIRQAITNRWVFPPGAKNLQTEVRIRLLPDGDVLDVKIIRSSGDVAFDGSVERAISKAKPLPVPPPETGLFDEFREMRLVFSR
ncbi:cell envelope integrity protein TolA [Thiolapillus sp.]